MIFPKHFPISHLVNNNFTNSQYFTGHIDAIQHSLSIEYSRFPVFLMRQHVLAQGSWSDSLVPVTKPGTSKVSAFISQGYHDKVGFSHGSAVKNLSVMQERHRLNSWVRKISWRRVRQPTPLVWIIPWTEQPGRLWSMGLQRVGYD